jgi:hypothetical protein
MSFASGEAICLPNLHGAPIAIENIATERSHSPLCQGPDGTRATIGTLAAEGHDSLIARMRIVTPVSAEEQKPHERLLDDLIDHLTRR